MHRLVLIAILLAAAFAWAIAVATSTQLHASDAAGNGLAQVFYVGALGIVWLLLAVTLLLGAWVPASGAPVGLPSRTTASVVIASFVVSLTTQVVVLPWLFDAANRGASRTILLVALALLPLAFLLFAAWRSLLLPLPTAVATWGCLLLVLTASLTAYGVRTFCKPERARNTAVTLSNLAYPVLLFREGRSVDACHHAESAEERFTAAGDTNDLLVVDANCARWAPIAVNGVLTFARAAEPISFDALRNAILRVPRLHDDAARDAEIRRLITMQATVSSLAFVLPH
jgi:hypothetical protein